MGNGKKLAYRPGGDVRGGQQYENLIPIDEFVNWQAILIYGPGSWTRAEILSMPAREFFQHIALSQRADADQQQRFIQNNTIHRIEKADRKVLFDRLAEQANVGRRRFKPTELVDDQTRILMIGADLSTGGARWARWNREDLDWLEAQGVTQSVAMDRHAAWLAQEMNNPFWTPARRK